MLVDPSVAEAQATDAIDSEFSVQRFNPAPGPRNYFTTRGARTDGEMAWSAGLVANYGWEPFVVVSCQGANDCEDPDARVREVKVVENIVTADVLGSLTIIPRLQLGLRVPVTYVKGQGIDKQGQPLDDGIDAVGMGDVELEGKFRIYGEQKSPVVLGVGVFGSAPLGHATSKGNYIGDATPSGGIRGIFDGEAGPFSFGANLAGIFKGAGRVGNTELGHEFRYGVGVGYRIGPVVRVLVDGFGATRFTAERGENSLEVNGGLQVTPLGSPVTILAGAGSGIVEGVGVPKLRAFLGFMFVHEVSDRDGDGIPDGSDKCPTEKEDFDGYEDSDGCPDPDNDLDGIPDVSDKCPMQAEDLDGFEDLDGCPDLDNDQDGIPDVSDRCPDKPENKNGFEDDDGCPDEKDTDQDGVPDEKDQCPNDPEDTDGFEDTDGCPDPDNDQDGIPDNEDECIDEPETKNGFEDEDGCPDEAPAAKPKRR